MRLGLKILPLLAMLAVQSSFANVILITSRASLSVADELLMSAVGPDGTTMSSGFSADTLHANTVAFTDSGSNGFSVLEQGNEWSGNFADTDLILWTGNINTLNSDAVPVTMTFTSLIGGVGMQIQPDNFGTSFIASIDVFDSTNTNIGSFTENGNSTSAGDNSAPFIGVQSTSANIKKITINIVSPTGLDFTFNELSLGSAALAATPEPSSLTLICCCAGLLPAYLLKRRSK